MPYIFKYDLLREWMPVARDVSFRSLFERESVRAQKGWPLLYMSHISVKKYAYTSPTGDVCHICVHLFCKKGDPFRLLQERCMSLSFKGWQEICVCVCARALSLSLSLSFFRTHAHTHTHPLPPQLYRHDHRQRDRQTDRQIDRHTHTSVHACMYEGA